MIENGSINPDSLKKRQVDGIRHQGVSCLVRMNMVTCKV
jgi:hypothetical protein